MAGFMPSDLSRLGISGVVGSRTHGLGGADIGSVARLLSAHKQTGGTLPNGLMADALRGKLVWDAGQQGMGSGMGQVGNPGPATTYAQVDPINKLQTSLQNTLSGTQSPLSYEYYRQAAMGNQSLWNKYAQSGGASNPYSMSTDMWNQYGAGLDPYNQQHNMQAYVNMTNGIYSDLSTKLGRVPTSSEIYAAQNHGADAVVGDPTLANQYAHMFL